MCTDQIYTQDMAMASKWSVTHTKSFTEDVCALDRELRELHVTEFLTANFLKDPEYRVDSVSPPQGTYEEFRKTMQSRIGNIPDEIEFTMDTDLVVEKPDGTMQYVEIKGYQNRTKTILSRLLAQIGKQIPVNSSVQDTYSVAIPADLIMELWRQWTRNGEIEINVVTGKILEEVRDGNIDFTIFLVSEDRYREVGIEKFFEISEDDSVESALNKIIDN